MVNNLKISKKFLAGLVSLAIVGSTVVGAFHVTKRNEINRIKGYLEDFWVPGNYVDLSKVTKDYDIKSFNGEYLDDAMEEVGVKYVRLTDTYVYDGAHVTPFDTVSAINRDKVLFEDEEGNIYYDMYEPIRIPTDNGVKYSIPDGYEIVSTPAIVEPYRYYRLEDTLVVVRENNYEESYSLSLEKKR